MTSPSPTPFDWEGEGRRIGEALDQFSSVVVLGDTPRATALVALGLARVQSTKRRVAIADLIGDAEPLVRQLPADFDPHGITDSFVHGISLNRIAREVPGDGELYIMPTGIESLDHHDIIGNPRWLRLAAGFREMGALLVIAANTGAGDIESLVGHTDGAILVGESVPRALPVASVIASVRRPRSTQPVAGVVDPSANEPTIERRSAPRVAVEPSRRVGMPILVLAILAVVGIGAWFGIQTVENRRVADSTRVADSVHTDSVHRVALAKAALVRADTALRVPPGDPPVVSDPADSAGALRYTVRWVRLNTEAGAILQLTRDGDGLPIATFVSYDLGQTRWYELRVGGYAAQPEAESLLVTLQGTDLVAKGSGDVIEAPYALLVDSSKTEADAKKQVATLRAKDVPAYALQGKKHTRVYVGAYQSPTEAMTDIERLRTAGLTPVLAYRIGRVH